MLGKLCFSISQQLVYRGVYGVKSGLVNINSTITGHFVQTSNGFTRRAPGRGRGGNAGMGTRRFGGLRGPPLIRRTGSSGLS